MKLTLLLLLFLSLFTACQQQKKPYISGKSVTIGILAPISAKNSAYAQQSLAGIKAAQVMKRYLSNGDAIQFLVQNSAPDNEAVKKALETFKKNKVQVILSFMGSEEIVDTAALFKTNKIPLIVTLATNNNITQLAQNITQVCFDNHMQAIVAAHFIKDEKFLNNVGILYNMNNNYSHSLAKEFKHTFENLGGKVLFYVNFKPEDPIKNLDFIKNKKIDILYNVTNAVTTLRVLKKLKREHLNIPILSTDGLLSSAYSFKPSDLAYFNNMYITEHYAYDVKKSKERKEFEKLLKKKTYKESSYAFLAYDSYALLHKSLSECIDYNYDKQCINNHLQNSGVIKGISGNFTIINAKAHREMYIDKIKDAHLYKETIVYW